MKINELATKYYSLLEDIEMMDMDMFISEEEKKIIEAIEKAAKVQMDKSSTEKDKIKAKKELKKEK